MTTAITSLPQRKTDLPLKNRVVVFEGVTGSCTGVFASQVVGTHQEISTTSTTIVSGVFEWLSKDPIGISGGLNQYVFCNNNGVNFIDPSGLYDETVHYSLTWLWATQEGINQRIGRQIALNNEWTDHGNTDPMSPLINVGNRSPHFQQNIIFGISFGKRWDLYKEAECAAKRGDLYEFGRRLHEFQDTFAHEGHGAFFGHLFAGTKPDNYDPTRKRDKDMEKYTRWLLQAWKENN